MPTSPPSDFGPVPGSPAAERAWLDLFYDLVFVAAILILSSAFSHAERVGESIWFGGAFVSVWWVWLATTMHANRFPADDVLYRLLTLTQMFLVALVAIGAGDGAHAHPEFDSICYSLLTFTVAVTYARSARLSHENRSFARRRAAEYTVAAAIFLVAGLFPDTVRIVLWLVGLAVTIAPAIAHCTTSPPLEERHLIERLGALTIIMCGEAFVKVALAANNDSLDGIDVVTVALEFVLVFAVWATYFDDVPMAGVSTTPRGRSTWLGAHLLLHLGIIGVAIGVSRFVVFHPGQDIPTPDVAGVAIPLAEIYLALIVISLTSRRRPLDRLIQIRLGAVLAVALVVGIAEWATWFDTYWSVAAFAFVAIAEAGFEALARQRTAVVPAAVES
ncbi:MAG: low temperature requirement protein A [Acidimicrobiia bacterium]